MEASVGPYLAAIGSYLAGSMQSVIGAGVGTALVAGGIALYRDKRQQKALATYTAMRVAIAFENFTYQCSEAIFANQAMSPPSGEQFPDWNISLAQPPEYPDDSDGWRALDIHLANGALSFPLLIQTKQRILSSDAEWMTDRWLDAYLVVSASLGIAAWHTAEAFRKRYGIELDHAPLSASHVVSQLRTTLSLAQGRIDFFESAREPWDISDLSHGPNDCVPTNPDNDIAIRVPSPAM